MPSWRYSPSPTTLSSYYDLSSWHCSLAVSVATADGPALISQPLLLPPPLTGPSQEVASDRPDTLSLEREAGEMGPPPPPPRKTGHSRSSSLDNNLILGDSGK